MKTANFSAQCSRLRSPITDKAFFSLQCHSAFIRLLDDSFPEYLTFDPDTRSLLTETCIKEGWGGLTRTSTASLNEGGYTIFKKNSIERQLVGCLLHPIKEFHRSLPMASTSLYTPQNPHATPPKVPLKKPIILL